MSNVQHVKANAQLVSVEPASREQFLKLFEAKR
jgi:hypothetical protein